MASPHVYTQMSTSLALFHSKLSFCDPEVSASLLWETLKAYTRGEITSYADYDNKLMKEKLTKLAQITNIEMIICISSRMKKGKDPLACTSLLANMFA